VLNGSPELIAPHENAHMGGNHVIGFKSSINAGNFINVFLHLLKIVSTKLDTFY